MNIQDINRCIEQLSADETTYSNCSKLASLLIVRDYFTTPAQKVQKTEMQDPGRELVDILPSYNEYCKLKGEFQLHHINKEPVLNALKLLCKEITEYLQALYSCTDMPEERKLLDELIKNFSFYR